ncbi:putative uncharacterized protein [Prevotella sp. CAG:1185]|nr:putative uncharacterized protein [Prevotella sp. CAG:1185]
MKKAKALLLSALMAAAPMAHADEGMWTLYNLPQAVYDQMKSYGFSLPYNDIYGSNDAIKNSVVLFGGFCSGVVVSPDGLVFTNHHCGFEAIRSHSTVEHDYMLNGFYAKSYEEELPNENLFVSFMVKQEDVSQRLKALGVDDLPADKATELIDSVAAAMTDEARKTDKGLHVEIDPYYEGNQYFATTYRMFTDVRLVFTVPKSMGKFGGETDNWMWPRQTCDFSVFRIYADPKTNGPAEYSKDNVPYKAPHWAQVSLQGYKDGDFAMTVGYPGSTERYLSSYGIKEMRDAGNATRVQVRGVKQEIMKRHMEADEAVRIKYDSKFAQSANYWKNSMGMNKCIDSIGIIAQKQAYEKLIRQYQDKTGYLKGKLDFDKMAKLYGERFDRMRAFYYWSETFRGTCELATRALKYCNGMEAKGSEKDSTKMYNEFEDNSDSWDEALDKEVFSALLKNYREHVDKKYLPSFYATIDKKFKGNCTAYVDYLYKKSILMKKGAKIYFNKKNTAKDPGIQLGLSLVNYLADQREALGALSDSIELQEKYLCAAKLRMEEDMPHYSDANMTMRLSYGRVGGFTMNGSPSGYYTTAESMVKKMEQGKTFTDYYAEPIMSELLSAKDFGQYQDKTTGKMQLCFLTNNDITGGNSGSPMFNGKGELIGLAFDGNWDSLSSDIYFEKNLARCIGVDIRYVLFMMDKWGHADRLLKEINAK